MKLNEVYHLIIYCLNCIGRDQNSTYKTDLKVDHHLLNWIALKACFIRRISVASNAIQTMDNEMLCFIICYLNCIRRDEIRRSKQAYINARFISRRISIASNAIQKIDNEA
jgi:hypothetical protein